MEVGPLLLGWYSILEIARASGPPDAGPSRAPPGERERDKERLLALEYVPRRSESTINLWKFDRTMMRLARLPIARGPNDFSTPITRILGSFSSPALCLLSCVCCEYSREEMEIVCYWIINFDVTLIDFQVANVSLKNKISHLV